jgi:hypothetical protein
MNVYNRVQHIKKARELIEDDMKQVLKGDWEYDKLGIQQRTITSI